MISQMNKKSSSTQKGRVLHDDEDLTSKGTIPLPGSWLGSVFQISYLFKVYVKHDAWNSIGEGSCVLLPLRIINSPRLIQSQEHYRVPPNWSPISGIAEPVYIYHEQDRVSEYYKNVFCENWKEWYAKIELPNPFVFGGEIKVAKKEELKKEVKIVKVQPEILKPQRVPDISKPQDLANLTAFEQYQLIQANLVPVDKKPQTNADPTSFIQPIQQEYQAEQQWNDQQLLESNQQWQQAEYQQQYIPDGQQQDYNTGNYYEQDQQYDYSQQQAYQPNNNYDQSMSEYEKYEQQHNTRNDYGQEQQPYYEQQQQQHFDQQQYSGYDNSYQQQDYDYNTYPQNNQPVSQQNYAPQVAKQSESSVQLPSSDQVLKFGKETVVPGAIKAFGFLKDVGVSLYNSTQEQNQAAKK